MRAIRKRQSPPSLTKWRRENPNETDWRSLDPKVKADIRRALVVRDQCGLCAYCQSRIRPTEDEARIEHFIPRAADASRTFDWRNLLAVCTDGDGDVGLYCEVGRKDRPLSLDPTDPATPISNLFSYLKNGELRIDGRADHPDCDVLRLNHWRLMQNRKAVHKFLTDRLPTLAGLSELRRELRKWSSERGTGLPEYAGCAEYFLRRWIRQRGG